MKHNLKTKVDGIDSTVMKVPNWAGRAKEMLPASTGTVLDKASTMAGETTRIRGVSVSSESSEFKPSGIMGSGIYDEPLTLDSSRIMDWARETTPVEDEPDVTDWMVPAKAYVATLKARSNEYDRAGSSLSVAAGDPFTPGVTNSQLSFKSERGQAIEEKGNGTVVAGGEEFEVPAGGNTTIVNPNILGWAAATDIQDKQWVGSLMSVEELTNSPSEPIGFPSIGNNTGPLFVGHDQTRPSIINRVSVGIQSNEEQTVQFKFRDSSDYTRQLSSFSQDVPKGQSTLTFRVASLSLEPMVAEIKPEDGTQAVLTDYSVFP